MLFLTSQRQPGCHTRTPFLKSADQVVTLWLVISYLMMYLQVFKLLYPHVFKPLLCFHVDGAVFEKWRRKYTHIHVSMFSDTITTKLQSPHKYLKRVAVTLICLKEQFVQTPYFDKCLPFTRSA